MGRHISNRGSDGILGVGRCCGYADNSHHSDSVSVPAPSKREFCAAGCLTLQLFLYDDLNGLGLPPPSACISTNLKHLCLCHNIHQMMLAMAASDVPNSFCLHAIVPSLCVFSMLCGRS